jgi:hypothetical protein
MLVQQAKTLSELAEKLDGASSVEISTKKKLTEEIDRIQVSIKSLIEQTDVLFDLYEDFAKTIFNNK